MTSPGISFHSLDIILILISQLMLMRMSRLLLLLWMVALVVLVMLVIVMMRVLMMQPRSLGGIEADGEVFIRPRSIPLGSRSLTEVTLPRVGTHRGTRCRVFG